MLTDRHFLVVEDDAHNLRVLEIVLKHANARVTSVGSAEAALETLNNAAYDALLIDLALPGMNGWELLERVRANDDDTDVPCFAITAYGDAMVEREARAAGFNGYFTKPIHAGTFSATLKKLIR